MEILALIIARGGSKGIPKKNILPLAGHPLIAYSIAAGLASEMVTRLVVSTDSEEIGAAARRYGAETPFLRPAELAQDNTPDLPVFQHALEWLAEHENYQPEMVVQLRPTSPFRRVGHIDQAAMRLIEHPEADSVRAVVVPFQNPFKMWQIGEDGLMRPLIADVSKMLSRGADLPGGLSLAEPYNLPRQILPDVYWQTGYVDAAWADTILSKNSMTGTRILPMVMEANEWIDIDTVDDWRRAERLIESGELSFDDLGYSIQPVAGA